MGKDCDTLLFITVQEDFKSKTDTLLQQIYFLNVFKEKLYPWSDSTITLQG